MSEDSHPAIVVMNSVSVSPHKSLHCDDWIGQWSLDVIVRGLVFVSPRNLKSSIISHPESEQWQDLQPFHKESFHTQKIVDQESVI